MARAGHGSTPRVYRPLQAQFKKQAKIVLKNYLVLEILTIYKNYHLKQVNYFTDLIFKTYYRWLSSLLRLESVPGKIELMSLIQYCKFKRSASVPKCMLIWSCRTKSGSIFREVIYAQFVLARICKHARPTDSAGAELDCINDVLYSAFHLNKRKKLEVNRIF